MQSNLFYLFGALMFQFLLWDINIKITVSCLALSICLINGQCVSLAHHFQKLRSIPSTTLSLVFTHRVELKCKTCAHREEYHYVLCIMNA